MSKRILFNVLQVLVVMGFFPLAAGVALALTAGLAVTCFVRAFAMGFLGIAAFV